MRLSYPIPILILWLCTTALPAQVRISEVMALNANGHADRYGAYPDWIELYNAGAKAVNLGNYYLSDDPDHRLKHKLPKLINKVLTIPPKGYLILYADGILKGANYLPFKLSGKGDCIWLTAPDGKRRVDSLCFSGQVADVSFGRDPSATGEHLYFMQATPGKENVGGKPGFSEEPSVNKESAICRESITLSVKSKGHTYYTTDGSIPVAADSLLCPRRLTIDSTVTLRFVNVEDGLHPSRVVTRSFIFGHHPGLPVLSLVAHPDHLFNPKTGIYNYGNYRHRWEKPMHIDGFDVDEKAWFGLDGGAQIVGIANSAYPQKSFAFFARSMYGKGNIKCRLFDDKDIQTYSSFVLRNGGNDWYFALIKDGMMQSLVKDLNIDVQAYRPVVAYLNGRYWGIYNLREKQNEEYLASNHDVHPDSLDYFELNGRLIEGTKNSYNGLVAFLRQNDFSSRSRIDSLIHIVDADNFMNYVAAQIYFANTDWPHNNVKFWKAHAAGSRWRFVLFDTDFGFNYFSREHNTMERALQLPPDSLLNRNVELPNLLLHAFLENDSMRHDFLQRMAILLNTQFEPGFVKAHIDSLAGMIEDEVPAHTRRWKEEKKGIYSNGGKPERGLELWQKNVDFLRMFAEGRPDTVRNHVVKAFGLRGTVNLTLEASPAPVEVNGVKVERFPWKGVFFQGVPLRLHYTGKEKKVQWQGGGAEEGASIAVVPTQDLSVMVVVGSW